jgi:hypothetical protein
MANCAAKGNYESANFIFFSHIFISSCSPHLHDSNAGVFIMKLPSYVQIIAPAKSGHQIYTPWEKKFDLRPKFRKLL